MKLNHISLIGFLMIVLLVSVVGFVSLAQLTKVAEPLNDDIPESIATISKTSHLDALTRFIQYYDEVLTQSARNYAFTQDKKWEQRYRNAEPELDRIIKEAIEKGDEKDKEFFSSVDAANLALVEMEYNAIDYVNKGEAEKAVEILESDEYWKQKDIYKQGLVSYVERRGAEYDQALSASTETLNLATEQTKSLINKGKQQVIIPLSTTVILLIALTIFISYSISKPIKKLTQNVNEIIKGNFDIGLGESKINEIQGLTNSLSRILSSLKLAVLRTKAKKEDIGIGTEEALKAKKKAEEKYKDLFENANDLIQSVDSKGKFVYVNKKWKQVLGYSDKEIKKLTFRDIISKEHLPFCNKIFKEIMKGKTFKKIETEFVTKQGKKIPVEANINSYSKDSKFFTRGIFRDITEKKKAEETHLQLKQKYKKELKKCQRDLQIYKEKSKKK